jgi:(E)-4-hydroxy-3-methylbut-2-enyl-diphosphate synthase
MTADSAERRETVPVKVGDLIIGGGFPISVQSMWKLPLREADFALLQKLNTLKDAGLDLLRFAVPDENTAHLLGRLALKAPLPLVADIHFDHKLALACLDYPLAKIRINPGNIGAEWKVKEVILKAADKGAAIRVGVNSGSLPYRLRDREDTALAMVEAAEDELEIFTRYNFKSLVFSLKASDPELTVRANILFSERHNIPLHLGVTEAGPLVPGVVKNTVALYRLLRLGIGDTLRVSLSAALESEIEAGKAIINAAGGGRNEPDIISCPTCGRTVFPVKEFYEKIKDRLQLVHKNIRIAIMGCPVNGPGEARQADLGITGTRNHVIIFKKGKVIRRELIENAESVFLDELGRLDENK